MQGHQPDDADLGEATEADVLEQRQEVDPDPPPPPRPSSDPEVPEADAWEQAMIVPTDDEE